MASFPPSSSKTGAKKAEAARETEQSLLTAKTAIRDLMLRPREERDALLEKLAAEVLAQEQRLQDLELPAKRRLSALKEVLSVLKEASEARSD
jgi:hypothetical protein